MKTNDDNELSILDHYKDADFSNRNESHPDYQIIQLLLAEGTAPNSVQLPQFVFSFPAEADARALAALLVELGFTSTVYAAEGEFLTYDVTSTKPMILEFEIVADETNHLRQLVKQLNGSLEGWWLSAA